MAAARAARPPPREEEEEATQGEDLTERSSPCCLCSADFVSSGGEALSVGDLANLGFPRDWPAAYTQSRALKALIGKHGKLPGRKVAVAGVPTQEDWSRLPALEYRPLQPFHNASIAAAEDAALKAVRGWAILERLDQAPGEAFVAVAYWWVALPCGRWVDVTPRPPAWPQLLLSEAAEGAAERRPGDRLAAEEQAAFVQSLEASWFPQAAAASGGRQAADEGRPAAQPPTAAGRRQQAAEPEAPQPRTVPAPARVPTPVSADAKAAPASDGLGRRKGLDYSKFNNIQDSDDEKIVPHQESMVLPIGWPRDQVKRADYDKVWHMLLMNKTLPLTPAPDLDVMWGYYRYGGLDEQALLDQACEFLAKLPCRLDPADYKAKTYTLTKKLEMEGRVDEARMWSIICISRYPQDPDNYYNQGVLLNKMCDAAKFGGAPTMRLHSFTEGTKTVPTAKYCALFSRAALLYYRRCLKVDPKQRAAYINLIGTLERNEVEGWYDEVHQLAASAVQNGVWYNKWQRPPHFVATLPAKPWHEARDFAMCRLLEEHYPTIRAEYDAYIERLANRKDWDDSDTTPGLGDVGNRAGALHDGGLTQSGSWREVPLFTNLSLQREYAAYFPDTIRILQAHCRDATGLALCGGGDVIFSVLSPGTRLRPHCGPSNSRLTCHLGIRVPRTAEQGCRMRVAAEPPRGWQEGKCVVFDDSFEHEVVFEAAKPQEPYPGDRVVLLANFWHPDFQFKNDPDWRRKSDEAIAAIEVESLPQTAVVRAAVPP